MIVLRLIQALCTTEVYINSKYYQCHLHFVSLLAEKEIVGSLKKVLFRSVTFEATNVLTSAKRKFSECTKVEAHRNGINKRWSSFICIMALSNVVGLPTLGMNLQSC